MHLLRQFILPFSIFMLLVESAPVRRPDGSAFLVKRSTLQEGVEYEVLDRRLDKLCGLNMRKAGVRTECYKQEFSYQRVPGEHSLVKVPMVAKGKRPGSNSQCDHILELQTIRDAIAKTTQAKATCDAIKKDKDRHPAYHAFVAAVSGPENLRNIPDVINNAKSKFFNPSTKPSTNARRDPAVNSCVLSYLCDEEDAVRKTGAKLKDILGKGLDLNLLMTVNPRVQKLASNAINSHARQHGLSGVSVHPVAQDTSRATAPANFAHEAHLDGMQKCRDAINCHDPTSGKSGGKDSSKDKQQHIVGAHSGADTSASGSASRRTRSTRARVDSDSSSNSLSHAAGQSTSSSAGQRLALRPQKLSRANTPPLSPKSALSEPTQAGPVKGKGKAKAVGASTSPDAHSSLPRCNGRKRSLCAYTRPSARASAGQQMRMQLQPSRAHVSSSLPSFPSAQGAHSHSSSRADKSTKSSPHMQQRSGRRPGQRQRQLQTAGARHERAALAGARTRARALLLKPKSKLVSKPMQKFKSNARTMSTSASKFSHTRKSKHLPSSRSRSIVRAGRKAAKAAWFGTGSRSGSSQQLSGKVAKAARKPASKLSVPSVRGKGKSKSKSKSLAMGRRKAKRDVRSELGSENEERDEFEFDDENDEA